MTYFDDRLKELHRQNSQKKHLEVMKAELLKQESEVVKKVAELEEIKKKEQLDVDKLEGKSIQALFFTLAGTKEEKLSKERQEAYAAAMKYDSAKHDLEGIEADLRDCQEELDKLVNCETEYEHLLEQKKNSIKHAASPRAKEVMLLEKDMAALEHEIIELEEALDVGEKVLNLVDKIIKELEDANHLAGWDIFTGSFLVDMQKREHIHTAQDFIQTLQQELRHFKTELADVNITGDIQIEMDEFSEFADWFFDNIFTDCSIKTKIENSLAQAEDTRDQITKTIDLLKNIRDKQMERRVELKEKLENIVIGE